MKVRVLEESGLDHALFGIGLSYGLTSGKRGIYFLDGGEMDRLKKIAVKLSRKGDGEDKYLRQVHVTLDITAPRFWWSEMDTYKVGTAAQSESTMHSIQKSILTRADFDDETRDEAIVMVNNLIAENAPIEVIKANLPEGFLQRRIWTGSYANLKNIIAQRNNHRLPQWREFISAIRCEVQCPELLFSD